MVRERHNDFITFLGIPQKMDHVWQPLFIALIYTVRQYLQPILTILESEILRWDNSVRDASQLAFACDRSTSAGRSHLLPMSSLIASGHPLGREGGREEGGGQR